VAKTLTEKRAAAKTKPQRHDNALSLCGMFRTMKIR